MFAHTLDSLHELHSRVSDGIHVRLLWGKDDDRVVVAVDDVKTGERFAIDLPRGQRAMDVFHHPFAYAAWRGVDVRSAPAGAVA